MTKSTANKPTRLILTCEHGGYKVPPQLKYLEKIKPLSTSEHRAWDPGALEATQFLSRKLQAPYFANEYSRLLIDCNRSDTNPSRFPVWTRKLTAGERARVERLVSLRFKNRVRGYVRSRLNPRRPVVLVSVHSFTPVFHGQKRTTDIGILFRPWMPHEQALALALKDHLKILSPLNVHLNRPYRGHTDCFVNELSREINSPKDFIGIMIELNYGLRDSQKTWIEVQWALTSALSAVLGGG